jgi:DNA-binding response OmpR family regulator
MAVDDDADILKLVSTTLSISGFAVITAVSGQECLALLEKGVKPALILLDIMMPGIDGFEVCRKIRAQEKYRSMKIVMLTARTQNRDAVDSYKFGADGFISKPFDPDKLIRDIKLYLGD